MKNLAYQVCNRFNSSNPEHLNLDQLVTKAQSSVKMIRYDDFIMKIPDSDDGLLWRSIDYSPHITYDWTDDYICGFGQ